MENEVLSKIIEYGSRSKIERMTWEEIKNSLNKEFCLDHSESWYRKKYKNFTRDLKVQTEEEKKQEDKIRADIRSRVAKSDELIQANALFRRMSREDTIREIAHDFAEVMNKKKMLPVRKNFLCETGELQAILLISDWHYGIEFNTYGNSYNRDVCKKRVSELRDKVISYIKLYGITNLTVVNLADMIAGRIHLQLRLNSRIDVVTQIMEVSEIIAEFLNDLSNYANINYYEVLDNHSRLEPNKKEAMQLESLARITGWYLEERLQNITVNENNSNAFAEFDILGHHILAVHGDKDKPNTVASFLGRYTDKHIDLVCTAHRHHFSCDETNKTIVVCNGTLMGTDEYAEDLRMSSSPSQNLIIVSKENPIDAIIRIILNSD